jgi:hypothetical protein
MRLRTARLLPAILLAWLLITRPGVTTHAQDAALPPDIAETMQRLMSTLDSVEDYERLLKAVEAVNTANACTPDQPTQSLGEALDWAIDAQFQADRDLVRGRSALDACRLGIADDALEGLMQQSEQVTQMTKVFSAIPMDGAAPSQTLDGLIEQTRWIAVLKSDAADLGDLARRLSEMGGSDAMLVARAAQARRLVEISTRAEDVVGKTLTCALAPQPLAGVRRISTMIEPIPGVAKELESALKAARQTCPGPVAAAPPKPAGPSWLPPPASETAKAAPASIPAWVPTKDAPVMVASTTRPADVVGQARDRLISDEAQRIEEQSRRYADARVQRTMEAERAQVAALAAQPPAPGFTPVGGGMAAPVSTTASAGGMMRAVLTTPVAPEQALAIAQRQVQAQQEQRASRGKSFLGVLGRVTAAVGTVAKATGMGSPALDALSRIGAVSNAAANATNGGGLGGMIGAATAMTSAAGVPLPPAATQTLSAMRMLTGPAPAMPGQPGATSPGGLPSGGPVGYLPPTPNEPFLGRWMCTASESPSQQMQVNIQETPQGLTLSTGVAAMQGTAANMRATFTSAMPTEAGICQLNVTLQPQSGALTGSTTVSCANAQPMQGTLQCRR